MHQHIIHMSRCKYLRQAWIHDVCTLPWSYASRRLNVRDMYKYCTHESSSQDRTPTWLYGRLRHLLLDEAFGPLHASVRGTSIGKAYPTQNRGLGLRHLEQLGLGLARLEHFAAAEVRLETGVGPGELQRERAA